MGFGLDTPVGASPWFLVVCIAAGYLGMVAHFLTKLGVDKLSDVGEWLRAHSAHVALAAITTTFAVAETVNLLGDWAQVGGAVAAAFGQGYTFQSFLTKLGSKPA